MRNQYKIASVLCSAAVAMLTMTSCEGGELYDINSPDWLSEKIDSINASRGDGSGMPDGEEDVYTIGNTDFTTGWWQTFSKYYVIPEGQVWNAVFNLNINPDAPNTYKNYALIICNDADRGASDYKEYGAIRYDNQPSGNSEWGDYIDRNSVTSTLTFNTDTDEGVQKLGGTVVLTIDRSDPNAFTVNMTNGTVTKTYKQKTPLVNLNDDPANTNIRAFLVPEGSYINFLQSNLEPIGGFTSAEDKQPVSMTLSSVPKKVLLGTTLDEAMANVSATVTFETGITKVIPAAELSFVAIPDIGQIGKKTLVAIYNKTFKNENCSQPITATAEFEVVDKMSNSLGATDNSTPFFGAVSDIVKVAPDETHVVKFTNYTNGTANWENFIVVMVDGTNTQEYGVVRADCFGWGTAYDTAITTGHPSDWNQWLKDMDGAKVTLYVTNNGDGTAEIKADIVALNGNTYSINYANLGGINPDDFYFKLTLEKAHLEFDTVVGSDDNSTGFFGAISDLFTVPAGKTVTTQFVNNTNCAANWNNFIVALVDKADSREYAIVRADNFGWGDGYAACVPACTQTNWDEWLTAMDGAKVNLSVTNVGDGTANIKATILGNNGVTYTQTYTGINTINPDDLAFKLTVEKAHLVFDLPFTANTNTAKAKARTRTRRW